MVNPLFSGCSLLARALGLRIGGALSSLAFKALTGGYKRWPDWRVYAHLRRVSHSEGIAAAMRIKLCFKGKRQAGRRPGRPGSAFSEACCSVLAGRRSAGLLVGVRLPH